MPVYAWDDGYAAHWRYSSTIKWHRRSKQRIDGVMVTILDRRFNKADQVYEYKYR